MSDIGRVERRGKLLIDRDIQLRFIGRLGGLLAFYVLLFLVISIVAPVLFTLIGNSADGALSEAAFRVEVLLRIILAPLLCTFVCLFAHGMLETFRIAGPQYRFRAVFRELERLHVPRGVRIRKGDYLQDSAAAFDRALVALHDQVAALKRESGAAVSALEEALAVGSIDGTCALASSVRSLDDQLRRFTLLTQAPGCQTVAEPEPGRAQEPPVEPSAPREMAASS